MNRLEKIKQIGLCLDKPEVTELFTIIDRFHENLIITTVDNSITRSMLVSILNDILYKYKSYWSQKSRFNETFNLCEIYAILIALSGVHLSSRLFHTLTDLMKYIHDCIYINYTTHVLTVKNIAGI